jgi:CDK inhibitor PHO81
VNIITPFRGATLGVGGAVETYWKSTAVHAPDTAQPWAPAPMQSTSPGSTYTSPSTSTTMGKRSLTVSSIHGEYVYVVIQVTRDLCPVAYPHWKLPLDDFDLGVADVSLAQFEHLADRLGRKPDLHSRCPSTIGGWHDMINRSMMSLAHLLTVCVSPVCSFVAYCLLVLLHSQIIPSTIGLCLELAYAPPLIRKRCSIRTQLDLNDVVDSVLRTIYQRSQEFSSERRRIVFTSFSPDLCAALNWKQPNCAFFFLVKTKIIFQCEH